MNWVDIVWSMSGAASLTLGLIHLSIWLRRRTVWAHLAFGLVALCAMSLAIIELASFRAGTPDEYSAILRLAHIPYALIVLGIVAYVHLRFASSRGWLALAAVASRLVLLVPNFLTGENLNFLEVQSLLQINLWGDQISTPVGRGNPWMLLGQVANILLMAYLIDVIVRTWRWGQHGQRMPALVVCTSILLFFLTNNTWSVLVVLGMVNAPIVVNVAFIFVVVVMGYELGVDVLRAASLTESLAESQSRLRESEHRLQMAATAGGLGLWSWKVGAGGSWLTDNGSALLGLAPGQKMRWGGLLARAHPDDLPGLRATRDAALSGAPYTFTFRILLDDGATRWLCASGKRDITDPQNPGIIRGVLQDVTDRQMAEERFRQLVENAPYAILMIGHGGQIALCNAYAEHLLGYPRSELTGMNSRQLLPQDPTAEQAGLRSALVDFFSGSPQASTRPDRGALSLRRKDGATLPVEIDLTTLLMDGNTYTIASIMDARERIRLEREAAVQRDELAHLSRIAMLGEISGSLAHELNQPLTAVLSNAQAALRFLKHTPPDLQEVHDSLLHIVESDKRASEVIRRLRAMMRKDAVKHEQMNVNDVVRESLQLMAADLVNRGVASLFDASPRRLTFVGDAVQIKQVLLNLFINACDAMSAASNARLLTVRTQIMDDGTIEIAVSDTGNGITPEDVEKIFSPFVTTKSEGMGLGLAICRTIIQAHAGRLWATNNDVCGATFHISLTSSGNAAEAVQARP